jgi:Flp pilus assembly pilin Flp
MLKNVRRFALRLHRDESGPNTVEWVLLIIVALIVLVAIYAFVQIVMDKMDEGKSKVEDMDFGE